MTAMMRAKLACAARRAAVLLLCVVAAGAVWQASASASSMGSMDSMGSSASGEALEVGSSEDFDTAEAQEPAEEDLEPLGLAPRLFKLSGKSTPAPSDGSALAMEGIGAVFPNMLSIVTTPSALSTGVQCHMDDVCGYDPCTCGKPDAWGHCACGGFQETVPTVSVESSDPGVARIVEAFGRLWVVPVSPGQTTITVTAELIHYKGATEQFLVDVAPFGAVDVLLIAAACVVVVAVCGLMVLCVRLLVGLLRRARERKRYWKARGLALKEEHPLTWQAKLKSEQYAARHHGRHRRARRGHPFLHDFALAMRTASPVLVAGLALFLVLVPVSTTVVNDISVFNIDYTHEQLKYQLFAQELAPAVNLASVCFGAVLAVVLFKFLLAKRATTAFFSVGLSRVKLFAARYGAGALCIVVGIGLPFALSLALNNAALGLYSGEAAACLFVAVGYIVVALVAFSLAGIAIACAGTLFETCAFAAALLAGVSVVLWGVGVLADYLLVGNAAGATLYGQDIEVAASFLDSLSWANPLLFFAEEGAQHQFFMALHPVYFPEPGNWTLVLGWFAAFVALSALGLLAFCHRAGEQAEMAGKAPAFSLVSVAVFGLAAFAAGVHVLGSVDVVIALVVGAALFVLVSLIMLFGPLRGRTARRVTLACVGGELVAMAAVVAVVWTGAFGYAAYIPNTEDVESVEVSYNGSPSYLTQGFSGVSSGSSYYYTSYRTYAQESSIDIVRSLHGQLIASARAARQTDYEEFQNTVVPYDVVLRYRMKDGSEVVRYYAQATVGELSALLALDNDEHTHELEAAVITGAADALSDEERARLSDSPSYNAYRTGAIYLADGALNRIVAVECDDAARANLLDALACDLSNLSASERYAPTKQARAALMFTLSPELDVASFGYSFSNAVSYITDDWECTMAWLQEHGYLDAIATELDARIIESLTFQLDDPYASINKVTQPLSRYFMAYRTSVSDSYWITQDYGALKSIDDQASIAEVLPNLRMGCFMTGGYLVEAKLRGIDAYVYFYLPAEDAPSYL